MMRIEINGEMFRSEKLMQVTSVCLGRPDEWLTREDFIGTMYPTEKNKKKALGNFGSWLSEVLGRRKHYPMILDIKEINGREYYRLMPNVNIRIIT